MSKRTRKTREPELNEAATATEGGVPGADFMAMMQEQREQAEKERARIEALQERSLRATERQADGLHELAAALREVGLAIVSNMPVAGTSRPDAATAAARRVVKPAEPKTAENPKSETKVPVFADVRKAIVDLSAATSSDVAFDVLRAFKVDAISDLKPEQYGDVIKAALAAMPKAK